MIRPRFRRLVAVAVVAAALLAAGCSKAATGGQQAAPAGPPEKTNITVAAVPTFDTAGLYIAQQRGLFAKQGLHVTIEPAISSETVLKQQMAGKIDITDGNYVSYIQAAEGLPGQKPDKLHLLAAASVMGPNNQMIIVPAGSPIHTIADLNGKTIGVNVQKNIGTLLVDSVLNNNAMLPAAVKYKAIPFPAMVKALQAHQIDAAWLPEPFVTNAEMAIGAQPLADADVGKTQNLPIAGYVATQAWVRKYPNTAAAFVRAITAAQRIASTSLAAVQSASAPYAHMTMQTASIVPAPSFPLNVDPVAIQRVADLMLQFGILQKNFNTAKFVDWPPPR